MKTAISVPNLISEEAESLASDLGVLRSERGLVKAFEDIKHDRCETLNDASTAKRIARFKERAGSIVHIQKLTDEGLTSGISERSMDDILSMALKSAENRYQGQPLITKTFPLH